MNLISKLLIIIFLTGTFISCTKAVFEETTSLQSLNDTIKYDPDIKTIMMNNCISCHGRSAPSGGFTLSNYNNVREKVEQGSLLSRINNVSNPMPPNGLMDNAKRETIQKWKTDGYLE